MAIDAFERTLSQAGESTPLHDSPLLAEGSTETTKHRHLHVRSNPFIGVLRSNSSPWRDSFLLVVLICFPLLQTSCSCFFTQPALKPTVLTLPSLAPFSSPRSFSTALPALLYCAFSLSCFYLTCFYVSFAAIARSSCGRLAASCLQIGRDLLGYECCSAVRAKEPPRRPQAPSSARRFESGKRVDRDSTRPARRGLHHG
jgi:hypothetical protein